MVKLSISMFNNHHCQRVRLKIKFNLLESRFSTYLYNTIHQSFVKTSYMATNQSINPCAIGFSLKKEENFDKTRSF